MTWFFVTFNLIHQTELFFFILKQKSVLVISNLNLGVNCDFSSNNNVRTTFYEFCGGHFKFCWIFYYDRLIGLLFMGFLAAIELEF